MQHDPNSLAPYFVEEIRRYLENKYGSDQVHEGGLRVYTSLDMDLQRTANQAVLDGLAAYERRHGWKGHLQNVLAEERNSGELRSIPIGTKSLRSGGYIHALVTGGRARFGGRSIRPLSAARSRRLMPPGRNTKLQLTYC